MSTNESDETERADIPPKGLPEKWRDIAAHTQRDNEPYAKALRRCATELEDSDRYPDTEADDRDRVVGHLEQFYTVREDGTAHAEGLEPGKYALVRFDPERENE
ncbi:hypothetical protein HTZ84_22205 [Haloterrigena sp. SYSU A558-1]|uniref:Uncharacterized protein n=1 Tax=Haloterrigena gelatinilytica TaxID=2741724 RepID=A0ABX2LFF3_9EURY|nr:hypothetical protein [Haloterrigena gelatinilytica]NUC74980.1 hypothetical protein [Haloterrigena gelatinilytica]